jgi:hypothetical protein
MKQNECQDRSAWRNHNITFQTNREGFFGRSTRKRTFCVPSETSILTQLEACQYALSRMCIVGNLCTWPLNHPPVVLIEEISTR